MFAFLPLVPLRALRPPALHSPRAAAPRHPTCALPRDLSIAAVSALSLFLVAPQAATPSPTAPFSAAPSPPPIALVHPTANVSSTATRPVVLAVAATTPIHEYVYSPHYASPREPPAPAPVADSLHDTRTEALLAVRLITAVLLGVMVGVERRATRLNLGVRSITLVSLTSALVSVTATSTRLTPAVVALSPPAASAAPALAVLAASAVTAAAVFAAIRTTSRLRAHAMHMSAVVGLVIGMGGACGAGLSLMAAAGYLAAIAFMRGTEAKRKVTLAAKGPPYSVSRDRELRVESDDGWDCENRMVFRIGNGNKSDTRVVEVGRKILPDGRPDRVE